MLSKPRPLSLPDAERRLGGWGNGFVGTGAGLRELVAFPRPQGQAEECDVRPEGSWASQTLRNFNTRPKGRWGSRGYTMSSLGDYRAGAIRDMSRRWEFRFPPESGLRALWFPGSWRCEEQTEKVPGPGVWEMQTFLGSEKEPGSGRVRGGGLRSQPREQG